MPSRLTGSGSSAGFGTLPWTGATISGEVPQVTQGLTMAASISMVLAKTASASLRRSRQTATARAQSAPTGANGRPLT